MPRRLLASLFTALLVFVALAAAAPDVHADEPRDQAGDRYAGPVVAADLAAWAAIGAAALADGDGAEAGLASIGVVGLVLGAPAVHLVEGAYGAMARSLALRFIVPSVTFAAAAVLDGEGNGPVLAAAVSMIAVQLYDAVSLARHPPPPRALAGRLLLPNVALGDGGVRLGLAGRF